MSRLRLPTPASLIAAGALLLVTASHGLMRPSPLRAEADGSELLARIGVTAVEKNYRGRKMVIDLSSLNPQVSKMTILHQLGGKERHDYDTSRSIVVIDGNYFIQYLPEKKLVVKRKLPSEGGYEELRRENLKQTLVSYELKSSPSEVIAGRTTRLYEFRPRQAGSRPLRKVWVDVETGLILRMEIYSPENRLFWLSVFEEIDYRPAVSPASFSMPIPTGVRVVESREGECLSDGDAEQIAGLPLSLPGYLPGGFVQKCIRARNTGEYGEIQVLYSDGLSLLSLFESTRRRPAAAEGRGKVSVRGTPASLQHAGLINALSWQTPRAQLTILGEIARDELLSVAESIVSVRELSRP